jgi:hypothetical protein
VSGGVEIKACLPLAVSQAVHPEERGIFLNFCLLPSRCPKSAKLLKVKIQQQIRLNRIANALSTNINESTSQSGPARYQVYGLYAHSARQCSK